MLEELFFFMYIFAGFAGLLAILMAILLIKYWSQGNKELLLSILCFTVCTALIDVLYFYFDYNMLMKGHRETNSIMRVADICFFIGQVYFWTAYTREKSMKKRTGNTRSLRIMQILIAACVISSVIAYGFLMKDYYQTDSRAEMMAVMIIEVFICISLTAVNVWNMLIVLPDIVQQKCRRHIIWTTVMLIVNGLWNGFLVLCMATGQGEYTILERMDITPIYIFIINILAVLLILNEDFTSLFKLQNEDVKNGNSLKERLDYIAVTHFLTEREREIMELAYKKMTNPEIAEELCISKYTVKNHMHNIFEKLDISTRSDLIMFIDKEK